MDYDIGYMWSSTPDQRARVRTVLENAWMIPGPKIDLPGARSEDMVKTGQAEARSLDWRFSTFSQIGAISGYV